MFGLGTLTLPADFARCARCLGTHWSMHERRVLTSLISAPHRPRLSAELRHRLQHGGVDWSVKLPTISFRMVRMPLCRLGWAVALGVMALSAGGLIFSGLLFTRLGMLVPRAQTFADFGDAAMGRRGRRLVYFCVYTCIALEPVILQLICTENLRQILHRTGISQVGCRA